MDVTHNSDGLNIIQGEILQLVDAHWAENNRALLLSTLGMKLRQKFGDVRSLFPAGIMTYLRQWPIVQIVQHPDIPEKIGVIPNDVPKSQSIYEFFEKGSSNEYDQKRPSYIQDFWNAFCGPFKSPTYVFFGHHGELVISKERPLSDSNQTIFEIGLDDVFEADSGTPMQDKVGGTHTKISLWLAKNKLETSHFLRQPVPGASQALGSLALLKKAFSGISALDQSRITIPLDIILKMD